MVLTMTIEELADKLREARRNAPPRRVSHAYILFGMKYADELESPAVSIDELCKFAGRPHQSYGVEIRHGMRLVQDGYATLNEDALWF